MKYIYTALLLSLSICITACSPHPASGVWKATDDNDYGISKVIIGFDGRANFTSQKTNNAEWHCFWSTKNKQEILLNCTPSSNPESEERFTLNINNKRIGELQHNEQLVTHLTITNENPSPSK